MSRFWNVVVTPRIVANAVRVALVVGSVLNLVNQGEQLLTSTGISWPHVLLNYVVPFCVASYSAAKNEIGRAAVAS